MTGPRAPSCRLSPRGRILLVPDGDEEGFVLPARRLRPLQKAFQAGNGEGLLHLALDLGSASLPPALAYWRDLGRRFLAHVCTSTEALAAELHLPALGAEEREELLAALPPMTGAENLDGSLLDAMWQDLGRALSARVQAHPEGLRALLAESGSSWHLLGRVCLHLAENRKDEERPFAFLATTVRRVSPGARPLHQPLGQALKEHAGARDRPKLLALLAPLSRAAETSPFLKELVDSGRIHQPLAWTPAEAHRFLRDLERYEQAGLVVRVPDWWSATRRPRPAVTVTLGDRAPSAVGLVSLLDFDLALSIDGEPLDEDEMERLLAGRESLVLLKGRWVEADGEALSRVLADWKKLERRARREGIPFAEALRLLAGAETLGAPGAEEADGAAEETTRAAWTRVRAGDWLAARLAELRRAALEDTEAASELLTRPLRPYQRQGLRWLETLRVLGLGGCLADDMGLGKTVQVIALLEARRRTGETGTDLLVVPASLLDNWKREFERFAPELKVLVAHPSRLAPAALEAIDEKALGAHHAVLSSYAMVTRSPWLRHHPWRHVILDEAQAIKNPGTKQSRAMKALPSRWRLALTGTPVENRPGDLWSLFDFLAPGLLGTATAFRRFCKDAGRREGGWAPLRRLVAPYVLRRLKTDRRIVADLPDKTELLAHCLLSREQAALYRRAADELAAALVTEEDMKRRGLVLAYLTRFKQICNHPSHWLGDGDYAPARSGKFARLAELCESIAARQDKVLVFTQYRELCAPLATFLETLFGRGGTVLHGGTAVGKRQALVDRFQTDESVPFMVLSLKAGGTGLNLTAASHVIHFDRWWNPAVEDQATDRAHRIGQHRNVLVHKFVCRGTVEERIEALLAGKKKLSDELLADGAERSLTELDDEELLELVSLDLERACEG